MSYHSRNNLAQSIKNPGPPRREAHQKPFLACVKCAHHKNYRRIGEESLGKRRRSLVSRYVLILSDGRNRFSELIFSRIIRRTPPTTMGSSDPPPPPEFVWRPSPKRTVPKFGGCPRTPTLRKMKRTYEKFEHWKRTRNLLPVYWTERAHKCDH